MIQAILFDLDNTLLDNPMERFLPPYFRLLGQELGHLLPPERLIPELMRCTEHVIAHPDPGRTNEERFWEAFTASTGLQQEAVQPLTDRFYEEAFPRLEGLTRRKPEARDIIQTAFAQGYEVVIATNPLFPRRAIEHRLAWAGIPVDEFPYTLVTTYEIMHASKPHPAYYQEILDMIGRSADETIMVGDDPTEDMAAHTIGIHTFWIHERALDQLPPPLAEGHGSLADFGKLLREGALHTWPPR